MKKGNILIIALVVTMIALVGAATAQTPLELIIGAVADSFNTDPDLVQLQRSDSTTYADTAAQAVEADSSDHADYADSAAIALDADTAAHADHADQADTAAFATYSDSARGAATAVYADSAGAVAGLWTTVQDTLAAYPDTSVTNALNYYDDDSVTAIVPVTVWDSLLAGVVVADSIDADHIVGNEALITDTTGADTVSTIWGADTFLTIGNAVPPLTPRYWKARGFSSYHFDGQITTSSGLIGSKITVTGDATAGYVITDSINDGSTTILEWAELWAVLADSADGDISDSITAHAGDSLSLFVRSSAEDTATGELWFQNVIRPDTLALPITTTMAQDGDGYCPTFVDTVGTDSLIVILPDGTRRGTAIE